MTPQKGDTVRLVEMNGCMATVRSNPRELVVVGKASKVLYGLSQPVAIVELSDGRMLPARSEDWNMFDGLLEYRL